MFVSFIELEGFVNCGFVTSSSNSCDGVGGGVVVVDGGKFEIIKC